MSVLRRWGRWIAVVIAFASCKSNQEPISNHITFQKNLSDYGLFQADMYRLLPAKNVEAFDIASPLFTDYAEKQRLIKIPDGKKMIIKGDSLPEFPEGSIIAKTLYYSNTREGRRIIETRLLILSEGKWNAATYQWNDAQSDADLLTEGAMVPISFQDLYGRQRTIAYKIPSQNDCSGCHRSGNELVPIGPKIRNLNINVAVNGQQHNQLTYLMEKGILEHAHISAIASVPDYRDSTLAIAIRARAYLEMNCAHCHNENGAASATSLMLDYKTALKETGIQFNKGNISGRMSEMGEYHMPKSGVTVLDDEGVQLISAYIKTL